MLFRWGCKGGATAFRFGSTCTEEGGSRWHTKEGDDPLGGPSWAGVATLTRLQLGQSGLNGPTRGENKATVQAKIVNGI
jgi:hypothetical protein